MRGQVVVDALMLVVALVIIVSTMHMFIGEQAFRSQSLRYQATQHQAALEAVLEKRVSLKGLHGRVVDIIAFEACNGCPTNASLDYCPGLEQEINSTLSKINKGQRHYIFASKNLIAYDDRKSVCLDAIPVARQNLKTKCGEVDVIYGSWLTSFNPPEVC